ncbi:MAG: GAF domain-containing protein [Steroidobacteraceae bacterium]
MKGEAESRFETFKARLAEGGARAGLEYLGSLSTFRFLSVIYYVDGVGHPVYHYDRLNPELAEADEFDQQASYCGIVLDERRRFETSDSMRDERLAEHPKRTCVRSYYGLPLFAHDGQPHAVLCHYDNFPKDTQDLDHELLQEAAQLLEVRLAQDGLERSPPTAVTVHTEEIGNSSLHVIQRTKAEWSAPRYSIERSRRRDDGGVSSRISYGKVGFSSLDEAIEFGREWCEGSESPEAGPTR